MKTDSGRAVWYGTYAGVVLLYYATALLLGLEPRNQVVHTWRGPLVITAGLGALWLVVAALAVMLERPRRGIEMARVMRDRILTRDTVERLVGMFLIVAGVNLMFDTFAAFKPSIPQFHAYDWDPFLADADRILHLGRPPWLWLSYLPGHSALVGLMDRAYVHWYAIMTLTVLGVVAFAPLASRLRFFFGYVALWIVGGTLCATLFASGGPVYYEHFTEDPMRFRALLDGLETTAPIARGLQDRLWTAYVTPGSAFAFEGISAMPSLHVAVAVYFALWAWRWGRIPGAIGAAYAVTIMVGSVALGWHYAIDGYAGALVAVGAAWAADRWVAPSPPSPA